MNIEIEFIILTSGTVLFLRFVAIRFLWLTLAPLALLQSDVAAAKVGYLATVIYCLLASQKQWTTLYRQDHAFRLAVNLSAGLLGFLGASGLLVPDGMYSLTGFRESVAYFFTCLLPLAGISLVEVPQKLKTVTFSTLGIAASLSYFFATIHARGASGMTDGGGLRSLALIGMVAIWSFSRFLTINGRSHHLITGEAIVFIAIASGTRTALALAVIPAALAMFAILNGWRGVKLLIVTTAVGASAFWAISNILPIFIANPDYYQQRYRVILATIQGSGTLQNDASFQVRGVHYQMAFEQIGNHPLLGTGPGHAYPGSLNGTASIYMLDTPWITVAKLGAIGCLLLLLAVAAWLRYYFKNDTSTSRAARIFVLATFFLFALATLPSGSILEDKGVGLGLLVLVGNMTRRDTVSTTNNDAPREMDGVPL